MRDLRKARNELANNGIEVTLDEVRELVKIARRMKKMSKLSQWELMEMKEDSPLDPDKADALYQSLMRLKK